MANDQVTKVYELRTLGFDQIFSELSAVNQQFIAIAKSKAALAKQALSIEDPAELAEITKQFQQQIIVQEELRLKKIQLTNEAKAAQVVRQQEINDTKAAAAGAKNAAGSYNDLYQQYRQLYALVRAAPAGTPISFQGDTLQFDQAITKLKELSAAEQAFRRQFAGDGVLVGEYTSGIVNAFKKLGLDDLIGGQITKSNEKLQGLNSEFNALKTILGEIKTNGNAGLQSLNAQLAELKNNTNTGISGLGEQLSGSSIKAGELSERMQVVDAVLKKMGSDGVVSLEAIERALIDNRNEAITLQKQVGTLEAEFRGTADVGSQITSSLSAGFKSVRDQVGQLVLGYIGFQAAFNGIIQGIDITKELADQTTNLEVELGKTKGGADGLVDALSKFDTRDKLTVLEDISNIAAKAGVSEENLVGVTTAIDKIKIAFGKDFGDVEQGTESLVKIVNIFQGTDQVTGDNLLKVGNAIRTLANESVASVPFLNDFTKRMAGLKGISDISLPSVLGLASGFEQFGQTAEVSSTALVRIIPKLAADTEKFAAVAGTTQESFAKLLNTNPAEALLQVSQGFLAGKASIEEFEAEFKDSGLGSGRVSSVIGVLGKNADAFRKSIDSAGVAFNNTGNLTTAFTAKNENLAAVLDKISKRFADAANSDAFKASITAIAGILTFVLANMTPLLVILGLLAASWAVNNAELILLNAQLLAYNLLIARNYIALGILTVAQGLATAATFVFNGAIRLVTAGFRLLGIAMDATPFGVIISVLGTLAGLFLSVNKALGEGVSAINAHTAALRINNQVHQAATEAISDQISKVENYALVVRDTAISENTRLAALKELIAINPAFSAALKGNTIDLTALNAVQKDYNANLLKTAELEAAKQRTAAENAKLVVLENTKQGLEAAQAQGKGFGDLTDDQQAAFSKITTSVGRTAFTSSIVNASISKEDFDEAYKQINKQIAAEQITIDGANSVLKDKYSAVQQTIQKGKDGIAKITQAAPVRSIQFLQDAIKDLDDQINVLQIGTDKFKELVKQREALQTELDAAQNKKGPVGHGDRLTPDEQNAIKSIDAVRDDELAEEVDLHNRGLESESAYLKNILDINTAAADAKMEAIKGRNSEELKVIAEQNLLKEKLATDTNHKLFEIGLEEIEATRNAAINQAKEAASLVINSTDPNTSATQKFQAKLDEDKAALAADLTYQTSLFNLEKEFAEKRLVQERKAADDITKARLQFNIDNRGAFDAYVNDIKASAAKIEAAFNLVIDANEAKIRANQLLTQNQRDDQIQQQENDRKIGILASQSALYTNLAAAFKSAYDKGLITLAQYTGIVNKMTELKNQIEDAKIDPVTGEAKKNTGTPGDIRDIPSAFTFFADKIFNVDKTSKDGQAIAKATSLTYTEMTNALNSYFDAEEARIKASLQLRLDQLDTETQQVEAHAESQAEIQTIDAEYDVKKKKAQQEALNEEKKIKRAQAALAFATELANIWGTVYELGPIAGPILGAILAGLAIYRYENTLSTINSQVAAHGLHADSTTTRGGVVKGRSHKDGGNPFIFKGRVFEDEVDELNVIRTKDAPTGKFSISGDHMQIASALNEIGGGIRFAPGASVSKLAYGGNPRKLAYGGNIGEALQPPRNFNPTSAVGDVSKISEKLDQLRIEMTGVLQHNADEQSKRIDRLQVNLDTRAVTNAQKKADKQKRVGQL